MITGIAKLQANPKKSCASAGSGTIRLKNPEEKRSIPMEEEKVLKKLQYKASGEPVLILGAPDSYHQVMDAFESRVDQQPIESVYHYIQIFGTSNREIREAVEKSAGLLAEDALYWLCYPKKSSKAYQSDCSRETVSQIPSDFGYEPVRQVAIDDDWSALRFRKASDIKKMTRSFAYTDEGKKRTEGKQS